MTNYLLARAEFLALFVNGSMTLVFLLRGDVPKAIYWGGCTAVVTGVIMMRS